MIITEKIDGIHGFVVIQPPVMTNFGIIRDCPVEAQTWKSDDDFGFVAWVQKNRATLILELGIGRHSGEWWGHGVRRGYGLTEGDRRFSLFDVRRFAVFEFTPGLGTVPVLYDGPFFETAIPTAIRKLTEHGSYAAERFRDPEGIVANFEGEHYRALLEPRARRMLHHA